MLIPVKTEYSCSGSELLHADGTPLSFAAAKQLLDQLAHHRPLHSSYVQAGLLSVNPDSDS